MKKVRRRAGAVLLIVALILGLTGFYVVRYALRGAEWASFRSNGNAYVGGRLTAGTVVDRNGTVLYRVEDGTPRYAESETVRRATLHAIGDRAGNIGTGALKMFPDEILGFSPVDGLYDLNGNGGTLTLSLDADVCAAAINALGDRRGAVAVMDYVTGELICMVSSPAFDPENPPETVDDASGVYLNRVLSSTFTPGSVYKLLTLAAAIENIDDLFERDFHCDGALSVGADAESSGWTVAQSVDGIGCAAGRYDVAAQDIDLGWSGAGQYKDLVNPAAMLRFVAAIANHGRAPRMTQLKNTTRLGVEYDRLMRPATADQIAQIMDYCVRHTYGSENFPGLALHAKSGTAEVGSVSPNAWFVGFIDDAEHPYCFVVCIENGGWGSTEAGPVANAVLQAAVRGEK